MTLPGADAPFIFIRPLWLLGLLALPGIGWAWRRIRSTSGWAQYIDETKLRYLKIASASERSSMRTLILLSLAAALLGLAGPSWRTVPLPVKQTRDAMIIAFDLSPSMLATDLNPDRLTRARLKIIDFLRLRQEGETALIAYADDAYRVSPLTDDTATIEALVPSLHPNVMPEPGSQVEAAVAMARKLLTGASIDAGVVLVVTDGIDPAAIPDLEDELGETLRLCILGVGEEAGAPIPLPGGGFARDANNQTILASLNRDELERLAARHGDCYADLRSDDADLERIFDRIEVGLDDELEGSEATYDVRHDEGYWLVVLLLPFAAMAFRRNVFWGGLLISSATLGGSMPAQALEWEDLWQREDQREVQAIESGIEAYRAQEYAEAATLFDGDSPLRHYNRGNALALAGQLENALESYDRALEAQPEDEDTRFNRDLVAKLLEDQQQQNASDEDGEAGDDERQSEDGGEPGDAESDSDSSEEREGTDSANGSPSPESSEPERPSSSPPDSTESEPAQTDPAREEESSSGEEPEESPERESAGTETQRAETDQAPLSDQSEQWLRNIPDDPGGLMRRKFQYQAETRRRSGARQRTETRY